MGQVLEAALPPRGHRRAGRGGAVRGQEHRAPRGEEVLPAGIYALLRVVSVVGGVDSPVDIPWCL